ncbi:PREDICTED: uncharacterized protein LOC106302299 [Brassica oleracea var. oleracea]|uniref:uncharacterized protein LOC106302299 n=1 Tax=Brassica oleracea var. oleracea TaxID=109376 RepID=UPI0006A6E1CA|nr:PREDICTED: uncharacterized protein LOC106302299 [Brassica oleracea var. oleracea]
MVAFDPEKYQRQDYVRVKVRIEVNKPLKRSRVLNLPGGDQTTIYFFYEKVQKRCTHCQRLTHAKDRCPFLVNSLNMQAAPVSNQRPSLDTRNQTVLSEDDPLFEVLQEDQVGINPISGRPRIAPEVLQEMRNYLLASSNEDRHNREQRVILSVKEAEQNPVIQKSMLQLTPPPIFTTDLNKGKGVVFNFDRSIVDFQNTNLNPKPLKLMASAISAGQHLSNPLVNVFGRLSLPLGQASSSQTSIIPFDGFSSAPLPKEKPKRKHGRYKKLPNSQKKVQKGGVKLSTPIQNEESPNKKRKAEDELDESLRSSKKKGQSSMEKASLKKKTEVDLADTSKAAQCNVSTMVPHEGPKA